jgi:hypothetical protein
MSECEICKQVKPEDEINHFDGHDYQYWAVNCVCDDCLKILASRQGENYG